MDKNIKGDQHLPGIISQIEKNFGKGSIMQLDDIPIDNIDSISTGSLSLDLALGVGGIPCGRIIEIYGPASSGKTTLSLQCIHEVTKKGGVAAFIDAEYALDRSYIEKLDVNKNFLLSQPNNGEEALGIAEELIKTGDVNLIVIDSVAALVPKAELEGEIGECCIGAQARLMSQALRKMTSFISKSNCTCIFINQLRDKIGGMSFGNPETTAGGNALRYYSSVRIDIRRISQIKDSEGNIIGNRTRAKVVKNKVAPPFRTAEFDIYYGCGVSKEGEIIDMGVEKKILKKNGAWIAYKDKNIAQGREVAIKLLTENRDLYTEIEKEIMDTVLKT